MNDFPSSDDLFCEAIQATLQIEEPAETANTLLKMIRGLVAAGNEEYARALLPRTLDRINELRDTRERAYLLGLFVTLQCEMRRLDDALETLPHLELDPDQRCGALCRVAVELAQVGRIDEALRLADAIEDLDDYETVLEAVGRRQAETLHFGEAIETVAKIEAGKTRCRLLQFVGTTQWKNGRADEALQTLRSATLIARGIAEPEVRDEALTQTAAAFIELHRMFDVLTLAREIEQPLHRIGVLCNLIVFLKEDGNFSGGKTTADEAACTARKIDDPFHRNRAFRQIGAALFEIGDTEEAKDLFREALGAIKSIRNAYSQAEILTEFGSQTARLKIPATARRLFQQALDQADTLEDPALRLRCADRILQAQAEALLIEDAFQTVERIEEYREELPPHDETVDMNRRILVTAYATLGQLLARSAEPEQRRKSDDFFRQALAGARQIADPLDRSLALLSVAKQRARTQQMPEDAGEV